MLIHCREGYVIFMFATTGETAKHETFDDHTCPSLSATSLGYLIHSIAIASSPAPMQRPHRLTASEIVG